MQSHSKSTVSLSKDSTIRSGSFGLPLDQKQEKGNNKSTEQTSVPLLSDWVPNLYAVLKMGGLYKLVPHFSPKIKF